jgi:hypothetical protein
MPIDFPGDELRDILQRAYNVASIALDLTAMELYRNVKIESPVDHGRLQGSWEIEQVDEFTYRLYTNVEYALAVHDGAKAHEIWAKGAKYGISKGTYFAGANQGAMSAAQALFWPGAAHPVRMVYHPGYAGNPFTEPAIATTEGRLDEFTQMALQQTGVA